MLKLVIPTVILVGIIVIYLNDTARQPKFERQTPIDLPTEVAAIAP